MIETSRRSFLIGAAASLITAPAIVRSASLMPVRGIIQPIYRGMRVTAYAGGLTIIDGQITSICVGDGGSEYTASTTVTFPIFE